MKERERALRKRKEREEQELERVRLKTCRKEAVESYQALLVETIKDPQVLLKIRAELISKCLRHEWKSTMRLRVERLLLKTLNTMTRIIWISVFHNIFYISLMIVGEGTCIGYSLFLHSIHLAVSLFKCGDLFYCILRCTFSTELENDMVSYFHLFDIIPYINVLYFCMCICTIEECSHIGSTCAT